ncbi:MAG: bacteriophage holin [Bacteroidetes bacterium]|nr:bacteriophage holin [Bacteroidota bacterium]
MKIDVKSFAFTAGLFCGFGLFFITLWIILFDGASGNPTLIGKVYRGYNISLMGSLIGFVWAFFDGLIGGAIFAWLYNKISGCNNSD